MCAACWSCILRRGRIVRRREHGNTGSAALVGACPGKHPKALATGWRTLAQVMQERRQARGRAGAQARRQLDGFKLGQHTPAAAVQWMVPRG